MINDLEETIYDLKSIGADGVGKFTNLSEVGIVDELDVWHKLNGDVLDYSGNEFNGTNAGATLAPGLKDKSYYFSGSSSIIYNTYNSEHPTEKFTYSA
jgi:hypothetical protein